MNKKDALWKALGTGIKVWEALAPARETAATFDEAVRRTLKTLEGDLIHSDNDQINQVWAVGKVWSHQLAELARKDQNYWIDVSGSNLLSEKQTVSAFEYLLAKKTTLEALREACDGLRGLILAVSIADHMDIKGVASTLVSTKALDIAARKEAQKEFEICVKLIDKIIPSLVQAMEAVADMRDSLQRFQLRRVSDNKARTEAAVRHRVEEGPLTGYGNLKVFTDSALKRMGIDAEQFKEMYAGRGNGRWFNIAVDKSTRDVYLVRVMKSQEPPIRTGIREEQLLDEAPLKKD
jgi:hypothetical protein